MSVSVAEVLRSTRLSQMRKRGAKQCSKEVGGAIEARRRAATKHRKETVKSVVEEKKS